MRLPAISLPTRTPTVEPIVEKILDTAGQKGTGKWTGIAALDEGVPLTLIGEAVFARCLSAMKSERVEASKEYARTIPAFTGDKAEMVEAIRQALYASKIISYAQGYTLMRTAAKTYGWNLNYGGIALMWRGGCIIRSVFLGKIKEAYDKNPELQQSPARPVFQGNHAEAHSGLAQGRSGSRAVRRSGARYDGGAELF